MVKKIASVPNFTVDAEALRQALELGTPEKKKTIPILVNALFEPQGKTLRITTTDLDQTAVTEIDAVLSRHKTHEAFTIPHRKTLDLLVGESGPVVFSPLENHWIRMTVGGVDYKLIGMARTNYPKVPDPVAPQYNVPGEVLTEMLGHTTFAISAEESRYTLNGALFRFNTGNMRIVATDGHRLAMEVREMDITTKNGTQDTIVPHPALTWLSKPKRIGKEFVGISIEDGTDKVKPYIFFHLPHLRTVFSTRKLSGQFPNWEAVFPRKEGMKVVANFESAEAVAKTLAKVARCADERSGAVRWRVNGKVTISAQSTEAGEAEAVLPAVVTGEGNEVVAGFGNHYMQDVLKVLGKKPVTISLRDRETAQLIESPEYPGFAHILMPMRI